MSKQPEARITEQILKTLKRRGQDGWWVKIHGGPTQTAGIPDIIGCYRGTFIAFEVKVPGKEDTQSAMQKVIFSRITRAGGAPVVVSSAMDAVRLLEAVDTVIEQRESEDPSV